jgi:hypothetical protein
MNELLVRPSLYAHVLNAFFLMISVIFLVMNYAQIVKCSVYEKMVLSLGFSVAVGIHALSHLGLEAVYGYNPLRKILL